jgi:hypothetical protein
MANPNDVIRDSILRHLYTVHQNARGPKGVAIGIRDLQRAMKIASFQQKEVNSNLDYLIQKGWVALIEEKKTYRTPGGTTQESISIKYKISDVGIDRLEGASAYQREHNYSNINITNIKGVTVVGSGNVVNRDLTDLSNVLNDIESALLSSNELNEEQKLNAISDIGAIQSQLSKPEPNRNILKEAWKFVSTTVTAASFVELMQKASELIGPLIGQ